MRSTPNKPLNFPLVGLRDDLDAHGLDERLDGSEHADAPLIGCVSFSVL